MVEDISYYDLSYNQLFYYLPSLGRSYLLVTVIYLHLILKNNIILLKYNILLYKSEVIWCYFVTVLSK